MPGDKDQLLHRVRWMTGLWISSVPPSGRTMIETQRSEAVYRFRGRVY